MHAQSEIEMYFVQIANILENKVTDIKIFLNNQKLEYSDNQIKDLIASCDTFLKNYESFRLWNIGATNHLSKGISTLLKKVQSLYVCFENINVLGIWTRIITSQKEQDCLKKELRDLKINTKIFGFIDQIDSLQRCLIECKKENLRGKKEWLQKGLEVLKAKETEQSIAVSGQSRQNSSVSELQRKILQEAVLQSTDKEKAEALQIQSITDLERKVEALQYIQIENNKIIAEKDKKLGEYQQEIKSLKEQVQIQAKRMGDLEGENTKLKKEYAELKQENGKLKTEIENLKKSKLKQIEHVDRLENKLRSLQDINSDINRLLLNMESIQNKSEETGEENRRLKETISDLNIYLVTQREENETLKNRLELINQSNYINYNKLYEKLTYDSSNKRETREENYKTNTFFGKY